MVAIVAVSCQSRVFALLLADFMHLSQRFCQIVGAPI
jgi:hypothetical protein